MITVKLYAVITVPRWIYEDVPIDTASPGSVIVREEGRLDLECDTLEEAHTYVALRITDERASKVKALATSTVGVLENNS